MGRDRDLAGQGAGAGQMRKVTVASTRNIDTRRVMAMTSRLYNPKSLRVTTPGTSTSGEFKPLPDTAEGCIGCNKACISNQVTIRPPRRRHPHRDARPATS